MRTSLSYAVIGLAGVFLAALSACQTEQPAANEAKAAPVGAQKEKKADGAGAEQPPPSEEAKDSEKPKHQANRLAKETSPYLLMHAHNPVDWFPWGDEAFAKARRENKAIFLSIGYSSCYWCHVMERESFMDEEIAKFLNDNFVCIKVDREERPDVDDIYMTSVQLMTQHGGWPLSAFLTPDAKPFFGGTYFPARTGDRPGGGTGFMELVESVNELWKEKPELINDQASRVAGVVKQALREQQQAEAVDLKAELLDTVQESLATQFDPDYGGFGYSPNQPQRPKFPTPPDLMFLVERARKGDEKALQMLTLTLEKMAEGGIRDHLGGGFHRYSTDRFWRIPHFEKMLYDNGQLATVYAEAYALKPRDDFRQVLVEMLDFVLREMTDESGAFYSAIDAETDAEEGKFYRWEQEELNSLLDEEQFKLMGDVYGLSGDANFEHKYFVPLMNRAYRQIAEDLNRDPGELEKQLAPLRARLLAARDKRERPLTDTKILTAWNGLMIRGFADAGRILKEERFTQAAVRAADFVLDKLQTDDGRLLRTYREGSAKLNAYIDDYAFLVEGLIALHRATADQRWLDAADALTAKQIELFWDDEGDGFYFTSGDHETLIARAKKRTDSVLPSANSVAAENLIYLSVALEKPEYLERAGKTIAAFGGSLGNVDEARHMPRLATALAALLVAEAPTDGPKAESD